MVTQALDSIYNQCLSACWLDCFGVLVTTRNIDNKKSIPVADVFYCDGCEINEHTRLLAMIPDESKSSIAYFELAGNPTIRMDKRYGRGWRRFTSKVNLVIWYNYKNLGYETSIKDQVIADMLKMLDGCLCNCSDHEYITYARLESSLILNTNPFTKYNYDIKCLDLHPYEYIHMQFNLSFAFNPKCLPEFECKDAIIC